MIHKKKFLYSFLTLFIFSIQTSSAFIFAPSKKKTPTETETRLKKILRYNALNKQLKQAVLDTDPETLQAIEATVLEIYDGIVESCDKSSDSRDHRKVAQAYMNAVEVIAPKTIIHMFLEFLIVKAKALAVPPFPINELVADTSQ